MEAVGLQCLEVFKQVVSVGCSKLSLSSSKSLSYQQLIGLWNEMFPNVKLPEGPLPAPTTQIRPDQAAPVYKTGSKCCYEYKRGEKKGTVCGGDVTSRSKTNRFCNIHLNYEKKSATEQTLVSMNFMAVPRGAPTEPVRRLQVIIDPNQYGNHEHQPTSFVFNVAESKVFGKQVGDKVVLLTASDVQLCLQYGFKYFESAVEGYTPPPGGVPEVIPPSGGEVKPLLQGVSALPDPKDLGDELEILEEAS